MPDECEECSALLRRWSRVPAGVLELADEPAIYASLVIYVGGRYTLGLALQESYRVLQVQQQELLQLLKDLGVPISDPQLRAALETPSTWPAGISQDDATEAQISAIRCQCATVKALRQLAYAQLALDPPRVFVLTGLTSLQMLRAAR